MQEDESKIKWSQFLAGDNEAYCWIYKVYIQMLFRYGHSFTSDTELIKDCIQDVFTGLYKNRKQLITPKKSLNFLMYLVIFLLNSTKKGRLNIYPLKFFNYLFNSIIKSQILFEKSTGLSIENPSINKA